MRVGRPVTLNELGTQDSETLLSRALGKARDTVVTVFN